MKYEDLEFTIIYDGEEITCSILSLIPKDDIESYVVFTDHSLDEEGNLILKYGRLIKDNGEYELMAGITPNELDLIKKGFEDDLHDFANYIIENS